MASQSYPENPVEEGCNYILVMAESRSDCGLAEPSGPIQRRGHSKGVSQSGVDQAVAGCGEFSRPIDETGREVRRHEGDAMRKRRTPKVLQECGPLLLEMEEVNAAHPLRQSFERELSG